MTGPAGTPGRQLEPLFDPRSVAVVGASNDPLKWGHGLARGALRGADRRAVYLVNRSGGEVLGQAAYRSLDALPGPAELVVVAVPSEAFEGTVEAALAAGARAIVGITAGLGELGRGGAERERAVVERVRAAGAVLLGPNCLGVFDAEARLDIGWSELPAGPIGLVSQSGNLALELALICREHGLGFSRFASLGNQADLEAAELVSGLARHPGTEVIALYLEDYRDGRRFASACHEATSAGKPVILLPAGRSAASARAARSHTGALVSDLLAVRAACAAAGVEVVSTPFELVELAAAALSPALARGRRIAVVGDGGGHGVIAADLAAQARLEVPPLSLQLSAEVAAELGPTAVTGNPVDLAGGGEQELASFERVTRRIAASGEVDALLLTGYFGGYAELGADHEAAETETARGLAEIAVSSGSPLVVQTMYPRGPAAQTFRRSRVPVYGDIKAAVAALTYLACPAMDRATGVPALPAGRSTDEAREGYVESRDLLAGYGVAFPEARRADGVAAALEAAAQIGYPVVLKALGLDHKSDVGGVVLGIGTPEELEERLSDMATSLEVEAYSVERMVSVGVGVELLVGARRDPRFGPVVLVGLGGVHAEILSDTSVALAPVEARRADELVRALRGAPLLLGARGRPVLDVGAAAGAIAAVSRAAADHPEIAEIEANPLLVLPEGAIALDARVVLDPSR